MIDDIDSDMWVVHWIIRRFEDAFVSIMRTDVVYLIGRYASKCGVRVDGLPHIHESGVDVPSS